MPLKVVARLEEGPIRGEEAISRRPQDRWMAKEITRHQDLQEQQEATREAQKATPWVVEATEGLNIAYALMISAKS